MTLSQSLGQSLKREHSYWTLTLTPTILNSPQPSHNRHTRTEAFRQPNAIWDRFNWDKVRHEFRRAIRSRQNPYPYAAPRAIGLDNLYAVGRENFLVRLDARSLIGHIVAYVATQRFLGFVLVDRFDNATYYSVALGINLGLTNLVPKIPSCHWIYEPNPLLYGLNFVGSPGLKCFFWVLFREFGFGALNNIRRVKPAIAIEGRAPGVQDDAIVGDDYS